MVNEGIGSTAGHAQRCPGAIDYKEPELHSARILRASHTLIERPDVNR